MASLCCFFSVAAPALRPNSGATASAARLARKIDLRSMALLRNLILESDDTRSEPGIEMGTAAEFGKIANDVRCRPPRPCEQIPSLWTRAFLDPRRESH